MHSYDENNWLFGGMALPQWKPLDKDVIDGISFDEDSIDGISLDEDVKFGIDPADQCSWLFKMKMK